MRSTSMKLHFNRQNGPVDTAIDFEFNVDLANEFILCMVLLLIRDRPVCK